MSHKLGIAVIGCGRIGITHLEAIKELSNRIELAALVDTNPQALQKVAGQYKLPKTYSSVEEALRDPKVEAAIVALPHNLHCPVTLQVARAGRHVLVEKPMAISVKETDPMIEAAEKAGVILMVGQSRRFIPALRLSKTFLPRIGKPFNMCLCCISL